MLGEDIYAMVVPHLTRSLMKKIYMPVVYGKTKLSSIADIEQALEYSLERAVAAKVASAL